MLRQEAVEVDAALARSGESFARIVAGITDQAVKSLRLTDSDIDGPEASGVGTPELPRASSETDEWQNEWTARDDGTVEIRERNGGFWVMNTNGTATYQAAGGAYTLSLDAQATWRYTDFNGKEWTLSKHTGDWRKFDRGLDGTLWTWSDRAQDWLYTGKPHETQPRLEWTSPDGKTTVTEVYNQLFMESPDGYFVKYGAEIAKRAGGGDLYDWHRVTPEDYHATLARNEHLEHIWSTPGHPGQEALAYAGGLVSAVEDAAEFGMEWGARALSLAPHPALRLVGRLLTTVRQDAQAEEARELREKTAVEGAEAPAEKEARIDELFDALADVLDFQRGLGAPGSGVPPRTPEGAGEQPTGEGMPSRTPGEEGRATEPHAGATETTAEPAAPTPSAPPPGSAPQSEDRSIAPQSEPGSPTAPVDSGLQAPHSAPPPPVAANSGAATTSPSPDPADAASTAAPPELGTVVMKNKRSPDSEGKTWERVKEIQVSNPWTDAERVAFEKAFPGYSKGTAQAKEYVREFDQAGAVTNPKHKDVFHGGGVAARTDPGSDAYMVRMGEPPKPGQDPGAWGWAIFTGKDALQKAQNYADWIEARIAAVGIAQVRREAGTPDQWVTGGISNWKEIQIVKISDRADGSSRPGGVAYWQGTIAPQPEGSPAKAHLTREDALIPGGGGQVLIDPGSRHKLQIVDQRTVVDPSTAAPSTDSPGVSGASSSTPTSTSTTSTTPTPKTEEQIASATGEGSPSPAASPAVDADGDAAAASGTQTVANAGDSEGGTQPASQEPAQGDTGASTDAEPAQSTEPPGGESSTSESATAESQGADPTGSSKPAADGPATPAPSLEGATPAPSDAGAGSAVEAPDRDQATSVDEHPIPKEDADKEQDDGSVSGMTQDSHPIPKEDQPGDDGGGDSPEARASEDDHPVPKEDAQEEQAQAEQEQQQEQQQQEQQVELERVQ